MTAYLTMGMQDQQLSHTWRTTIQETIEGGEKRSALQTWPRVTLDNQIQFTTDQEKTFIRTMLSRELYGFWKIPIISDKTTLSSQAASGQKVLAVTETDYRHFYDGRECALINPDDWESYEIVEIDTIDSSTQITAADNLVSTWPTGTLVFPLYQFRITDEQELTSKFHTVTGIDINAEEAFETQRTFTYTLPTIDTGVFPTYNSLSLFLKRPRPPISEKFRSPYTLLMGMGIKTPFSNYDHTRGIFDRNFQFTTKKEIYDHLDFFDAMQGRLGSFYAPTWMNDIVVNDGFDSADVTLTTKKIYFTESEITGKHVYIEFPDGSYATREISARPTDTSITLDSAIDTTVAAADIAQVRISFLPEVRFNQDEMKLNYQQKNQGIARTSLGFNIL
jgi:hypothetical protein